MDAVEFVWEQKYTATVFRFDGRILEFFNVADGASRRYIWSELTVVRDEPDRKGRQRFRFTTRFESCVFDTEIDAEHAPGFDAFLGSLPR